MLGKNDKLVLFFLILETNKALASQLADKMIFFMKDNERANLRGSFSWRLG